MPQSRPRPSLLHRLREIWQRIRRRKPPADPYADRLVPVQGRPKGRSGAAVAELDEGEDSYFPPRRQ
ncbi:MAG TPA: hypothetical protein VFJ47_11735 [Terriglobales bacterium]|nr:hypothetical protein [Terriglobales bacterium]